MQSRWAVRNTAVNKASGCDKIPAELFRSLKDDAIKGLHSLCQQIWKTQQWPQDWKRSSSQFPRRVVPKNVLTIGQFHSSPMLAGCHHRLNGHEFQQAPGVIDREAWCAVVHD